MPSNADIARDLDDVLRDFDKVKTHPGNVWPNRSSLARDIYGRLSEPARERPAGDVSLHVNSYRFLTSKNFASGLVRGSMLEAGNKRYRVTALIPQDTFRVIVLLEAPINAG